MNNVKVIIKEPNSKPYEKIIDQDKLSDLFNNRLFDCFMGMSYSKGIDIYCLDSYENKDEYNCMVCGQRFKGKIVFIGYDGGEDNISLDDGQIKFINQELFNC